MSLPKDGSYDGGSNKPASKGFAYAIIIMVIISVVVVAGAVWLMSWDNQRTANNNEWIRTIDNAYLDCGYGTSFENEACMQKVDAVFNKFCKDFDSC